MMGRTLASLVGILAMAIVLAVGAATQDGPGEGQHGGQKVLANTNGPASAAS
ncbi:hypothetical protein [Streptomyces sp. NL15-2K]|uniref:hypothetical protein n=1 Tax=Streptomyces sp. NL15-2K TaxID=376149 RepID=UPI000FFA7F92|nr:MULTISPECIES: hypothetical protein [Actinomycetes]WKX06062.1 hypothetical protein Q4V64_00540 [Kutzneria buriramensis]GCB52712.1 hypothetical protein SNL152K_10069 [Streptomyces sp. NL15-2K]